MSSWYVVYTKPKKDAYAEQMLRDQGFETFRPKIRFHRIGKESQVTVTESLFPRYLFIRLDEETSNWVAVRSTTGVSNFVRFGKTVAKASDQLIGDLQSMVDANNVMDRTKSLFNRGDAVTIIDGSFCGHQALVTDQSGEKRVVVLLGMLGRQVPLTVPITYLEKRNSSLSARIAAG